MGDVIEIVRYAKVPDEVCYCFFFDEPDYNAIIDAFFEDNDFSPDKSLRLLAGYDGESKPRFINPSKPNKWQLDELRLRAIHYNDDEINLYACQSVWE